MSFWGTHGTEKHDDHSGVQENRVTQDRWSQLTEKYELQQSFQLLMISFSVCANFPVFASVIYLRSATFKQQFHTILE